MDFSVARPIEPVETERPCTPTPCGPNSQCREVGNIPACSCQPGYLGVPPECRPECISNSQCAPQQACVNSKCQDPCSSTCGFDSECRVVNHQPVCSCPPGYTGDPFSRCRIIPCEYFFIDSYWFYISSLVTLSNKKWWTRFLWRHWSKKLELESIKEPSIRTRRMVLERTNIRI